MRSGALVGGRYRLRERLGAGGAGEVWRAEDERLAAPVAVKLLHDTRPDQAARLAREARLLARLAHPRIVRCTDCDPEHDPPFLVMELIDGGTLQDRGAPLPPAEVREVLGAILEALDAAHAEGVAHRDLTPANVLLDRAGGVVVTDFGLARARQEPRVTASGILVGTPEYWSPEQARGAAPSAVGDLYSAGTIAFELLTGQLPFPAASDADRLEASSRRLVEDAPPVELLAPAAAAADPELARLVDDLLTRDPDHRPSAAAARRRLVTGATVRLGAGATAEAPGATVALGRPGWVARAAFAALALLAGGAIAFAAATAGGLGRDGARQAAAPSTVASAPLAEAPGSTTSPATEKPAAATTATAAEERPATAETPAATVPQSNATPTDTPRAAWEREVTEALGRERELAVAGAQGLVADGKWKRPKRGGKGRGLSGVGSDVEAVRAALGVVVARLGAVDAPDDETLEAQQRLAAAEAAVDRALQGGKAGELARALDEEAGALAALHDLAGSG